MLSCAAQCAGGWHHVQQLQADASQQQVGAHVLLHTKATPLLLKEAITAYDAMW